MDLREKDGFGMEKRSDDLVTYQSPGLSAEWQLGNQPMVSGDTPAVCQVNQMGSSPCPSVSMVDSFCSSLWNNPTSLQSLGFCDTNVSTNASSSGSGRQDMGGAFLPTGNTALSPIISHLPTDAAFIERAARFSSFNGSNYSRMVNPISTPESMSPYSIAHGSKSNDSGEPEFSGGGGQEGTPNLGGADGGESSSQGISVKKRKRINQEMESDQIEVGQKSSVEFVKESVESKQKGERNSSKITTAKAYGKQAKDSSDSPKDDCVHVRARSGQATNSHSLAERVRREKISERMKFLQELVPGCSKVTGKAVMLDEIINYVQSLQRQVEFLSMKLAAVNPRLDFNIEGLLSKDFLQSWGISSSAMGFSLDMMHPQLHLPPQSLIQAGMSGMTNPSEALRRAISTQLNMINEYKEPPPQMPGTWDDELHNVIQMNFDTNNPHLNTEELNGKDRDGFSS